MLQIIDQDKKESVGTSIGRGLLGALGIGKQYADEQHENQAAKKLGVDLSGIKNPQMRHQIVAEALRGQAERQKYSEKLQQDAEKETKRKQEKLEEESRKKAEKLEEENRKKEANKPILRYLEKEAGLAEGELEPFAGDIASAQRQITRKQKAPIGGLGGTPLSPEESESIQKVLRENPDASAEELEVKFISEGLSPGRYGKLVESRRQAKAPVYEPEAEKLEAKRIAEYTQRVAADYQSAKLENERLAKQRKLAESGKLSTPLMVSTLNAMHLPIGVLGNPDTEEYQKVESDFVRDVSSVFPGQIRVYEIQSYMKTIPSLMNSDEGKKIIIRNREILNEAKLLRYQAFKDILKENKGKKPQNMDFLVEEKVGPQLDALSGEYINGIQQAADKFQRKVKMRDQEGRSYTVPADKVDRMIKKGLLIQ